MKRYTITLGASTTAGGKVITASANGRINGVKIALENDLIFCPACKSQGKIACVGLRKPETWNGRQVALENDLCMCGCLVLPKLISDQRVRFQVIEDVSLSYAMAVPVSLASVAKSTALSLDKEVVEQFFSLLDENDQPMEGFRYDLYKDGALHTKAANFSGGDTVKIPELGNLKLVSWFNTDGATRHG